jgi:hypothetical protein
VVRVIVGEKEQNSGLFTLKHDIATLDIADQLVSFQDVVVEVEAGLGKDFCR